MEQFSRALQVNGSVAETWNNRGTVLNDLKRFQEAIADFERAIQLSPRYAEALCNKGKALTILRRFDEALAAFEGSIAIKPDLAEAWLGRGNIFYELKRYNEAITACERALRLKPSLSEAWIRGGDTLYELKRYPEALSAFDRALASNSDVAEVILRRGNVLFDLQRYDDALAAYDKALALSPDLASAWLGRGNVFATLGRSNEAFAAYDRALAFNRVLAGAWLGRGNLLRELKRYDDAVTAYDTALALEPELAEGWLGRGNVYAELKRYDDAFASYDRALTLKPDLANAWLGRGSVFFDLTRYDEAFAAYDKALALKPDLAEAWQGCGNVAVERRRYQDELVAYDKAFELKPDLDYLAGQRLHVKQHLCDWINLEAETAKLLAAIGEGKLSSPPFALLAMSSSAADQLQCARGYVQDQPVFPAIWRGEVYSHERIRLAYLSADFREHPVAYLTAGLFEHHDRSRFETTAISLGPDRDSPTLRRLKSGFEHFIDVRDNSDQEIAELIRRREVDIAINLMGFAGQNRHAVPARRPAPIQVNYLGYAGTTGADYVDYILADSTTIPEDQCVFFAEQVVWLPDSFLVNDNRRAIAERIPTRRDCGLPEGAFVYCCFNNSSKLAPETFHVWMRLLKATGDSVLWLSQTNATAQANLRREAERCGVAPQRLIFAAIMPEVADHLARLRQADLFLDTLPYNAHTTACDALWAGLPVLTCLGTTFAGRVAASLLKAIGVDELITHSLEDYEALALKLARDRSYLACIREKLARNRNSFPCSIPSALRVNLVRLRDDVGTVSKWRNAPRHIRSVEADPHRMISIPAAGPQ